MVLRCGGNSCWQFSITGSNDTGGTIILDAFGATEGVFLGSQPLSALGPAALANLRAGNWYFNIFTDTASFPQGEIRGQILAAPITVDLPPLCRETPPRGRCSCEPPAVVATVPVGPRLTCS